VLQTTSPEFAPEELSQLPENWNNWDFFRTQTNRIRKLRRPIKTRSDWTLISGRGAFMDIADRRRAADDCPAPVRRVGVLCLAWVASPIAGSVPRCGMPMVQ
jgi:hypothetical protein